MSNSELAATGGPRKIMVIVRMVDGTDWTYSFHQEHSVDRIWRVVLRLFPLTREKRSQAKETKR